MLVFYHAPHDANLNLLSRPENHQTETLKPKPSTLMKPLRNPFFRRTLLNPSQHLKEASKTPRIKANLAKPFQLPIKPVQNPYRSPLQCRFIILWFVDHPLAISYDPALVRGLVTVSVLLLMIIKTVSIVKTMITVIIFLLFFLLLNSTPIGTINNKFNILLGVI